VNYAVEFHRRATKELKRLDRTTLTRIDELAKNPYSPSLSRQMEANPDARYSRVGDWRIIYRAKETERTLDIVAIKPRGAAYP
jgi:mRNA-degrading endonuclease RelE of RelBE toxin-antitoxin system